MAKQLPKGRPDKRYRNSEDAPTVVSERRMTFFLPDAHFKELRRQVGYLQIHNIEAEVEDDPLPESPSALVREAIEYWLDGFRLKRDQSRTDKEWEARLDAINKAMPKRR